MEIQSSGFLWLVVGCLTKSRQPKGILCVCLCKGTGLCLESDNGYMTMHLSKFLEVCTSNE